MRIRPLLAVLAVIALVAAPTAGATTKKKAVKVYCHLVSDKTSDGQSDGRNARPDGSGSETIGG